MATSPNPDVEPILTFEGRKYDINSLPSELKELLKGLQVADKQLRFHEEALKVIAYGRQSMAKQLNDKLKDIKSLP